MRKSLWEPPAKRSAKRSLEKVVPRPPQGVLGSIREPSGRSGSASGGPGRAPRPLWTPPGSAPDRPWSPRNAPGPPPSDFWSILRRSCLNLGSIFLVFLPYSGTPGGSLSELLLVRRPPRPAAFLTRNCNLKPQDCSFRVGILGASAALYPIRRSAG